MKKRMFNVDDTVLCWDFVIDNINYHLEYNAENEIVCLKIPQTFIICKAKALAKSYPEVLHLDRQLLYAEILRFIESSKTIRYSGIDSSRTRYAPQPISPIEDVYQIAYDGRTDMLYLSLPTRNLHMDLKTALVLYPELDYMHEGVLHDVILGYVAGAIKSF